MVKKMGIRSSSTIIAKFILRSCDDIRQRFAIVLPSGAADQGQL
jgi:hypothetical protein